MGSDWEWLRANAVSVELKVKGHTVMPECVAILRAQGSGWRPVVSRSGATEAEAITRCAVDARTLLESAR